MMNKTNICPSVNRFKNGTFECECKHGFTGDGYVCYDIDECEIGKILYKIWKKVVKVIIPLYKLSIRVMNCNVV